MTQHISLLISDEMASDLNLVAAHEDATRGEVIRDAIRIALKQRVSERAKQPALLRAIAS